MDPVDEKRTAMLPERWNLVKDKLYAALELEGPSRAAYLEEIGKQDPELRSELDSLIASYLQASTAFLNQPAAHIATLLREPQSNWIGRRLGPYQLIHQPVTSIRWGLFFTSCWQARAPIALRPALPMKSAGQCAKTNRASQVRSFAKSKMIQRREAARGKESQSACGVIWTTSF